MRVYELSLREKKKEKKRKKKKKGEFDRSIGIFDDFCVHFGI